MKQKKKAGKQIKTPPLKIRQLAERLKSLRMKKGYTSYEAFALDHNLSRALYGRYEKGRDLRYSSLVKVVEAFDLTLEEFFSEGFK